jgi:hypothetical protein
MYLYHRLNGILMVSRPNQLMRMLEQHIMKSAGRSELRLLPTIDRDLAKIVEFPPQFSRALREQKARVRSAVRNLRGFAASQTPVEEVVFSVLAIAAIAGVSLLFL